MLVGREGQGDGSWLEHIRDSFWTVLYFVVFPQLSFPPHPFYGFPVGGTYVPIGF